MSKRDERPTSDPSSLEVVVARERALPCEIRAANTVAHAHGVREILARERARAVTPADETPEAPRDAAA
jgi:hypothetical protein